MRLYMDSSAFVKYYGKAEFEKGTIQLDEIIEEVKDGKHVLFSSYWLVPEVASTIDSWARKRFISKPRSLLPWSVRALLHKTMALGYPNRSK